MNIEMKFKIKMIFYQPKRKKKSMKQKHSSNLIPCLIQGGSFSRLSTFAGHICNGRVTANT